MGIWYVQKALNSRTDRVDQVGLRNNLKVILRFLVLLFAEMEEAHIWGQNMNLSLHLGAVKEIESRREGERERLKVLDNKFFTYIISFNLTSIL